MIFSIDSHSSKDLSNLLNCWLRLHISAPPLKRRSRAAWSSCYTALDSSTNTTVYTDLNLAALSCRPSVHVIPAINPPSSQSISSESSLPACKSQVDVVRTNYDLEQHETPPFARFTDEQRFAFTEMEREKAEQAIPSASLTEFEKQVGIHFFRLGPALMNFQLQDQLRAGSRSAISPYINLSSSILEWVAFLSRTVWF